MSKTHFKYLKHIYYGHGRSLVSREKVKIVEKKDGLYYENTKLTKHYLKRRVGWGKFVNVLAYDFELSDTPFLSQPILQTL